MLLVHAMNIYKASSSEMVSNIITFALKFVSSRSSIFLNILLKKTKNFTKVQGDTQILEIEGP